MARLISFVNFPRGMFFIASCHFYQKMNQYKLQYSTINNQNVNEFIQNVVDILTDTKRHLQLNLILQ